MVWQPEWTESKMEREVFEQRKRIADSLGMTVAEMMAEHAQRDMEREAGFVMRSGKKPLPAFLQPKPPRDHLKPV
jgi:hypothetical protein